MKGSTLVLETERQLADILTGLLNDKEPKEIYHVQGVVYKRDELIELIRERHNKYARVRLGKLRLDTWISERDAIHAPTRKLLSNLRTTFHVEYGPTNPKVVEMGVSMEKKRKKYGRRKK